MWNALLERPLAAILFAVAIGFAVAAFVANDPAYWLAAIGAGAAGTQL